MKDIAKAQERENESKKYETVLLHFAKRGNSVVVLNCFLSAATELGIQCFGELWISRLLQIKNRLVSTICVFETETQTGIAKGVVN